MNPDLTLIFRESYNTSTNGNITVELLCRKGTFIDEWIVRQTGMGQHDSIFLSEEAARTAINALKWTLLFYGGIIRRTE